MHGSIVVFFMCDLCNRTYQPEIPVLHEDERCWVTRCASHRNKIIVVLNRHARHPNPMERAHMDRIAQKFLDGRWIESEINPASSIPEHFHLHEL